jgi:hypothetical protein
MMSALADLLVSPILVRSDNAKEAVFAVDDSGREKDSAAQRKKLLATGYKSDFFLKYPCNVRPICEVIKTRRRSNTPIFQPNRKKAAPTSVKQATLSTPCTICPPSPQKQAPSLKSANPVIAARMIVMPIKQKSIARGRYSKKLSFPRGS